MRRDEQQAIDDNCKQIKEKSVTNFSRDLYKVIKTLIGNFKPTIDALRDENGFIVTEGPQVKQRWKEYCENLYKKSNIQPTNQRERTEQEDEPPPNYSKVEQAIKDLKNNKSPGFNDIPVDHLKKGSKYVTKHIHRTCVAIWKERKWPTDWKSSVFVSFPKGDTSECGNNRAISRISYSSKILLKTIANRMQKKLKTEIPVDIFRAVKQHNALFIW